jgi:hypothetical protein
MDKDHENIVENPVYLLFKPKDLATFEKFVNEEYEVGLLKEEYDYEGGYTVLVYEFPKKFAGDYATVLAGRYSKTSQRFKDIFPDDDIDGTPVIATLVMRKDARLKKQREESLDIILDADDELWSVFETHKETLDITKIKNNG